MYDNKYLNLKVQIHFSMSTEKEIIVCYILVYFWRPFCFFLIWRSKRHISAWQQQVLDSTGPNYPKKHLLPKNYQQIPQQFFFSENGTRLLYSIPKIAAYILFKRYLPIPKRFSYILLRRSCAAYILFRRSYILLWRSYILFRRSCAAYILSRKPYILLRRSCAFLTMASLLWGSVASRCVYGAFLVPCSISVHSFSMPSSILTPDVKRACQTIFIEQKGYL